MLHNPLHKIPSWILFKTKFINFYSNILIVFVSLFSIFYTNSYLFIHEPINIFKLLCKPNKVSLSSFRKTFKSITIISTSKNLNDLSILNKFSTCDYLICNTIRKYKHLTPQN